MWSPIVLLCLVNMTDCITVGGPLTYNKENCIESIKDTGIPYLKQKYPNRKVINFTCYDWGTDV